MASKLTLRQYIPLPPHPAGDFDHGDVYLPTGRVFVANTAAGTIEVIDGERLRHLTTIPDCPQASGVLCAQDEMLVFAAARGGGREQARVPIAGQPDAIWHNHRLGRLYIAIAHLGIIDEKPGVIEVLNTRTMTIDEQLPTEVGAHTTTYDALRQRLYVFLPSCRVAVYEESEVR